VFVSELSSSNAICFLYLSNYVTFKQVTIIINTRPTDNSSIIVVLIDAAQQQ